VDGGKGQLSRARAVIDRHDLSVLVPVVALAKENEELYLPDQLDPVILPRRSQGLYLVQRIRDEAHRFALRQHQRQRRREGLTSKLDDIAGIGPARKRALLKIFGDLDRLRQADVEELAAVPGISMDLAVRVKDSLEVMGG